MGTFETHWGWAPGVRGVCLPTSGPLVLSISGTCCFLLTSRGGTGVECGDPEPLPSGLAIGEEGHPVFKGL